MASKQHAILSASSSDRWLHCPPSARLCETYEDKGSNYAAEGTDAHALSEYKLKAALGIPAEDPTENLTWYSEEMDDCTSGYAEYVLEQVEAQGNLRRSSSPYRAACGLLPLGRTGLRNRRLHHHRGRYAPGDRLQTWLKKPTDRIKSSLWALLYFQVLEFKYSTSFQTVVRGLLCREIGSIPWFWIWLARVFAL